MWISWERTWRMATVQTTLPSVTGASFPPRGITIDPSNVRDVWGVDRGADKICQSLESLSGEDGTVA